MFACDCEVLKILSTQFPPSSHGYSTTLMASFFHPSYLSSALSEDDLTRLCFHIFFGRPVVRSAYDGHPSPCTDVDCRSSPRQQQPMWSGAEMAEAFEAFEDGGAVDPAETVEAVEHEVAEYT